MSIDAVVSAVLGIAPVPGLSAAFTVFKFIVSCVNDVQASKKQLRGLAIAVGQLLAALQREFESSRLVATACARPLNDLKR
jgi:hypothetical protein